MGCVHVLPTEWNGIFLDTFFEQCSDDGSMEVSRDVILNGCRSKCPDINLIVVNGDSVRICLEGGICESRNEDI